MNTDSFHSDMELLEHYGDNIKAMTGRVSKWDKSLWHYSPDGRDFIKLSVGNDAINLQIQKRFNEQRPGCELVIWNLEQCTEDHDYDNMNKSTAYDSEYEDTEHKWLLADEMSNHHENYTVVSENCEKKDAEKEETMQDRSETEKQENEADEKHLFDTDSMIKHEKEDMEILETKDDEEDKLMIDKKEVNIHSEMEKFETEEREKAEVDKTGCQLAYTESEGSVYTEIEGYDNKKFKKEKKKIKHHPGFGPHKTRYEEKMLTTETGDHAIDSGFSETGTFIEDPESAHFQEAEVPSVGNFAPVEVNFVETPEIDSLTFDEMSHEPDRMLISKADDFTKSCNDILDANSSDTDLTTKSETRSEDGTSFEPAEKGIQDCEYDGVYSQKQLIAMMAAIQPLKAPQVLCTDLDWMKSQEQKWKNVSSSTLTTRGPVNCKRRHPGSGSSLKAGSNGNSGGASGSGTSGGTCGSEVFSSEGSSSRSTISAAGGCGGSGGDDNDKWKKEGLWDIPNGRKEKQAKQMKKKLRQEKADHAGLDTNSGVFYGQQENLGAMALRWERNGDILRSNAGCLMPGQLDGIILDPYRDKFCIKDKEYSECKQWDVSISEEQPLGDDSRLTIPNQLGSGIAGKCYPCVDIETRAEFLIKQIDLLNFYASEITILLDLEHSGIVKVYGALFSNQYVYIMMELIYGPTLQEVIETEKHLSCVNALHYMRQLLEILSYIQCKGIIHDDIKAENIMIRHDTNSIVLIDFGISKKTRVARNVIPQGSQCLMSPEKAASEGYDTRADVWAATAVLVHMLSGNAPWSVRFKHKAFLHLIINETSPPLEDVPGDIPQEVRSLIESGWTIDPESRPFAQNLLDHEAFNLMGADEIPDASIENLSTAGINNLEQISDEDDCANINLDEFLSDGDMLIQEAMKKFGIK